MKHFLFFLSATVFHLVVTAQSPVGKWKLTAGYTEDDKGIKTDLVKEFVKEYPCIASAVYEFSADGKLSAPVDKCPASLEQQGLGTKWKIQKNKILVYLDEEDTDPTSYDLQFEGNKMRWSIHYPETEGIRRLVFEYTKA